jgi:septal ring factor EnvC (AmiA/AmiB activator)
LAYELTACFLQFLYAPVERRYDLLLTETRREAAEAPRPLKSIIESLKAELRDERHAATNLRHNNSDLEKEITELNIELRRVRARLPTAGPVSSEAEKEIDALKRQADRMRGPF